MRRNPFPVLVSVVAATCAVAASNPGGGTEAPTLTGAARCPDARGFTCSTLTVPLDHGGRAKGSLRLRVATQDVSAPRGILVFLTGGPGQPGERFALRVASRLGAAVDGYRIVMFDQRGTGAGALRCPALQAQMGSSDLAVPTKAAVVACARAIGPKRRYFSTAQTVEDLDALRRALKVETLTLDGVSYGTFVAERYALRYPNRIARLVLDSVVRTGSSTRSRSPVRTRPRACSAPSARPTGARPIRQPTSPPLCGDGRWGRPCSTLS